MFLGLFSSNLPRSTTERFTDLGKLNFPMVVQVLGSSQFSVLPQLPSKTMLNLKVVKIDSKISNSLR
jgi:hypothetical protein